jgi:hypothetical protein
MCTCTAPAPVPVPGEDGELDGEEDPAVVADGETAADAVGLAWPEVPATGDCLCLPYSHTAPVPPMSTTSTTIAMAAKAAGRSVRRERALA